MTIETCDHVRERLAAFLDDELPGDQSYAIQAHLDRCERCRGWARLEQGFTRAMSRRLRPPEPRREFLEKLGDRLGWTSSARRGPHRRIGAAVYAAAAGFLAAALLVPLIETYAPGLVHRIDRPFELRRVSAVLVCFECARAGASLEEQRHCHQNGHATGILCEGTGLWHLVANEVTGPVTADAGLRGRRVDVEGRFLEDIRYVDARSITLIR